MIWSIMMGFHHFLIYGGWVLILFSDMYLRLAHMTRMRRGKYYRWTVRQFGLLGDLPPRMFFGMTMVAGAIAGWMWAIDAFYIFLGVTCAVDWITGSDDPPWRRWSKAGAEILKKLKIAPAPEPAVNA